MKWVRIILFGLLMLFVQTTVFNNLHTLGVCHPFVYVLFLICLPVMPLSCIVQKNVVTLHPNLDWGYVCQW